MRPWSGERALPLWLPLPEYAGFLTRDVTASLAAGLRTRPIAETAAAHRSTGCGPTPTTSRPGGLEPEDEAKVLREWHARAA